MSQCNGCSHADRMKRLRKQRKKTILLNKDGWTTLYIVGEQPLEGQSEPYEHNGKPLRFVSSYMALAHSYDEDCRR